MSFESLPVINGPSMGDGWMNTPQSYNAYVNHAKGFLKSIYGNVDMFPRNLKIHS